MTNFYKFFIVFLFLLLVGCGSEATDPVMDPVVDSAVDPVAEPPTSQTINQAGNGVMVAPDFTVSASGNVMFAFSHDGTANFIVDLKNSNGQTVDLLINEIGAFTGSVDSALEPGVYHLSVNADGNWTAAITGFITDGTTAPPVTDLEAGIPASLVLLNSLPAGARLSQGGEAQISATVRDMNSDLVPDGVIVSFIADRGAIAPQAATVNGVAVATFQAGSAAGPATITASIVSDSGLVDDITVTIDNGPGASVIVAGVEPATIGILGSGIADTALITFEIHDSSGNPAIDGTQVAFSLATPINGGESLSVLSAQSAGGLVTVALQAGTVPGSVAVRASIDKGDGTLRVTEAKVTISNNRPDAGRITMGSTVLNLAGGVTLGLQSEVSAYIGDRAGNVVPDGWPVSFLAECGTIGTSGGFNTSTEFGVASATFQTSAPAPEFLTGLTPLGDPGFCRLVAYTPGKGNFQDLNGNGVFDGTDVCTSVMDEPYVDANDSGSFEAGEYYVDTNENSQFDTNVVNCVDDSMIWTSMNLLVSDYAAPLALTPSTFNLPLGDSAAFSLSLQDVFGNALVAGTEINISADGGTLLGQTSYTMPDMVGKGGFFNFAIASDQAGSAGGDDPLPKFVTIEATLVPAAGSNNNGAEIFDIAAGMINLVEVVEATPTITLNTGLPVGSQLAQGEDITLTAIVFTEDGELAVDGTVVSFSSSNGLVLPASALTLNGVATSVFTAPAFGGQVSLTANALGVSGLEEVSVSAGDASTIVISSIAPANIGVRGSGLTDTAIIVFDVLDQVGNPAMDGTEVNFTQTAFTGGGERLSSSSAQVVDGQVQVVLQSGVRSGTVEVAALLTVSSGVNVTTTARVVIVSGLPDAKHFSLSASVLNLPGYIRYGETSSITAYLADRYSNPVPIDTPVYFESEAGAMVLDLTSGGFKTNESGQASATQITQAPEPQNANGLSTVLAWTVGAESFIDLNGNGFYDADEPFGDLGEPFIDADDSGSYDAGSFDPVTGTDTEERYVDLNLDGRYSPANGEWDGQTYIWTDIDVLWSGRTAAPIIAPNTFNIATGTSQTFTMTVVDENGNPLSAGSEVVVTDSCFLGELSGDTSFEIPDTNSGGPGLTTFSVTLSSADTKVGDQAPCYLEVKVTSPNGDRTTTITGSID